jgi:uncharacterized Zn-binding protein involved in type VI secretion
MPGVTLLSDMCSGHGCFPSRQNDTASSDVFVEGRGIHRQSDHWTNHCCPNQGCHDSVLVAGSSTVFINGLGCGRIGDAIECGSTVMTGSATVFAG